MTIVKQFYYRTALTTQVQMFSLSYAKLSIINQKPATYKQILKQTTNITLMHNFISNRLFS